MKRENFLHVKNKNDSSTEARSKREIIAGMLGNAMEWYDFAAFGYFSDIVAKVFFPQDRGKNALIRSFCIFGSAFVVRPIGSVVFGTIGDTYGRKVALTSSILLMTGATFTIGCLPTYSTIGWPSYVSLLLARLLQGFSVGGQYTTALLFKMEGSPTNTWAFSGAVVYIVVGIGILLGSLLGYSIRQALDEEDLEAWGWRIPFLLGALLGLPGLYLKYYTDESDVDKKIRERQNDTNDPIKTLYGPKYRAAFIPALLVPMMSATSYYLTFVWVPVFMKSLVETPIEQAYLINSMVIVISVIVCLLAGIISDKYFKRKHLMLVAGICQALFSPLLITIIGKGEPRLAFFAQVLMSIFGAFFDIPMYAWLAQSFPAHVRLSGLSISYNLAFATVGGFSPALATWMLDKFGQESPGLLITGMSCISITALCVAPTIVDHRIKISTQNVVYDERSRLLSLACE